jgi:hypothetical protein
VTSQAVNTTESSPCQSKESFFYTLVVFGASFKESQAEFVSQFSTLFQSDSTFLVPIAFVSDQDLVNSLRCVLLDIRMPCLDVCASFDKDQ